MGNLDAVIDYGAVVFKNNAFDPLYTHDKAFLFLQKAISQHDDPRALSLLGEWQYFSNTSPLDDNVGIENLIRAATLGDHGMSNRLARHWLNSGINLPSALSLAKKAVQLSNDPHYNDTLGWAYVLLNKPKEGLPHIQYAEKFISLNWEISLHRAYGEFLNGDFELSKRRFKKSLDLAKKINNDEERISAIKSFIYRYYNKSFN